MIRILTNSINATKHNDHTNNNDNNNNNNYDIDNTKKDNNDNNDNSVYRPRCGLDTASAAWRRPAARGGRRVRPRRLLLHYNSIVTIICSSIGISISISIIMISSSIICIILNQ